MTNNYTRKSHTITRKYTNLLEHLGQTILQNTKPMNIKLLKSIQTTKPIFKNNIIEKIMIENPLFTPEIISKTLCFLALIYKNQDVFKLMKPFLSSINETKHNDYIISMIGSYFPEAEIIGGNDNEVIIMSKNSKKKMLLFTPWIFMISLFAMMFTSYVSYNQLLFIQKELGKNTAFSLVKDIGSAARTCDFNQIHLSNEEESIFKVIKFSKVIDKKIVDAIENTLKLRKCILDPNNMFETEVFNQNIRTASSSSSYQKQIMNIDTNIIPTELESKIVITESLALVPSSSIGMLVPTETMTKYIKSYNAKIYEKVEAKIRSDINVKTDPTALIQYFKKMEKMDLQDFKRYFEESYSESAEYSIPTLKDLNNILGIFGGTQDSMFELFIKGFSGMNIVDVVYRDYKKRMISIHTELTIKRAELDKYIEFLIADTATLIAMLISFKTILCWFIFVTLNFGYASYKMTQFIRENMKNKINVMPIPIEPEEDNNRVTRRRRKRT